MDIVTDVHSGDARQRTVSRQHQCAALVDSVGTTRSRPEKKRKGSKERRKSKGENQGKAKRDNG